MRPPIRLDHPIARTPIKVAQFEKQVKESVEALKAKYATSERKP